MITNNEEVCINIAFVEPTYRLPHSDIEINFHKNIEKVYDECQKLTNELIHQKMVDTIVLDSLPALSTPSMDMGNFLHDVMELEQYTNNLDKRIKHLKKDINNCKNYLQKKQMQAELTDCQKCRKKLGK